MSLIFQSLQKLDEHQETPPSGNGDPGPVKASSTLRSIRWLLPVAIGLALSLALGSGAVYGVQYLKDRMPEKVRPSDRHERRDREDVRETSLPVEETSLPIEETPSPIEETSSVAEETSSAMEEPLKSGIEQAVASPPEKNEIEPVSMPQYQFHPPVQENAPKALASMAPVEPEDIPPSTLSVPDAATPIPVQTTGSDTTAASQQQNETVTVEAPPVVDGEREAVERARRAALAKSARIGRLVRQIEQALGGSTEAGDPGLLLKKLAHLKGENHPYVAKLRAYHNFQRGNMALAEADLYKVMAVHPDDLEAGINLALIEIHDQRYEKALERLKILRQTYPENERIADLIKRLQ